MEKEIVTSKENITLIDWIRGNLRWEGFDYWDNGDGTPNYFNLCMGNTVIAVIQQSEKDNTWTGLIGTEDEYEFITDGKTREEVEEKLITYLSID